MLKIILTWVAVFVYLISFSQERKKVEAVRISETPRIDGLLDELFWQTIAPATDFVQFDPYNGAKPSQPTEVMFAYDNNALYVGVILYDSAPDSILKEAGVRDEVDPLNADMFSVDLIPYNDGLNSYEFKLSASGIQSDQKYSPVGQDPSWNAVWESAITFNENGWIAELKIPFAALRFPEKSIQEWGMNIWRQVRRKREWSTWNYVDRTQSNTFSQYGVLSGICDIKPSLRLAFYPYVSYYAANNSKDNYWDNSLNGGMDVKYGINESFTVDAVLVPDFGQVQSDDRVLNLSPFEIRYDEKRQFFTEGTELFNKCGLFYSRRIGDLPVKYDEVYADSNEIIKNNPENTRMINAVKFSGRTGSGLGTGLFNAMTSNTWATLKDTITSEERKNMTQPFTNYNIFVLDQNLKNSSYISIVNTNVLIDRFGYDANVSGTEFKLCNKKNTWTVLGNGNVSQHYIEDASNRFGYLYMVGIGKISGRIQYNFSHQFMDDKYDPNDFGFLTNNNQVNDNLTFSYRTLNPFGKILTMNHNIILNHTMLYKPSHFTGFTISATSNLTFKNYLSTGSVLSFCPTDQYNYYEARVPGRLFLQPGYSNTAAWISTDYRKPFAFDLQIGYFRSFEKNNYTWWTNPGFRVRVSNRMFLTWYPGYYYSNHEYGFVKNTESNSVISTTIGRRNVMTWTHLLTARYIFSTKASLSLRGRYYWLRARYNELYLLKEDGSLGVVTDTSNYNINNNIFNIDMQFVWNFAPGSEMSIVWKNTIFTYDQEPINSFVTNFGNMLESPQINSFSIKLLYYLDYAYLSRKKH